MAHRNYNRKVKNVANPEDLVIPEALFEDMWQLFVQIGKFWDNLEESDEYRSDLLVFMKNRISLDPSYLHEYKNASAVIKELTYELGEEGAYEKLFTSKEAIDDPPSTPLASARSKVSNEFIVLQLSVGGFKAFGAKNSLGYIAGGNIKGDTPYRTIPKKRP